MVTVRNRQQVASYELSSDSDDDDVQNTVVAVSSPAPRLEQIHDAAQVPRRFSSDDRPITPMRNQMLYSMMLESHEFVDGVYCTDIYAFTGSWHSVFGLSPRPCVIVRVPTVRESQEILRESGKVRENREGQGKVREF